MHSCTEKNQSGVGQKNILKHTFVQFVFPVGGQRACVSPAVIISTLSVHLSKLSVHHWQNKEGIFFLLYSPVTNIFVWNSLLLLTMIRTISMYVFWLIYWLTSTTWIIEVILNLCWYSPFCCFWYSTYIWYPDILTFVWTAIWKKKKEEKRKWNMNAIDVMSLCQYSVHKVNVHSDDIDYNSMFYKACLCIFDYVTHLPPTNRVDWVIPLLLTLKVLSNLP